MTLQIQHINGEKTVASGIFQFYYYVYRTSLSNISNSSGSLLVDDVLMLRVTVPVGIYTTMASGEEIRFGNTFEIIVFLKLNRPGLKMLKWKL